MKSNKVINTMVAMSNYAIDDCNGAKVPLIGMCVLNNGKIGALIDTKKSYAVRELYVKNGTPHIKSTVISGTVTGWIGINTEEGIKRFNNTVEFGTQKIAKVILIKVVSVTDIAVQD